MVKNFSCPTFMPQRGLVIKPHVFKHHKKMHETKGYTLIDLNTNEIFLSRNVCFFEHVFPFTNNEPNRDGVAWARNPQRVWSSIWELSLERYPLGQARGRLVLERSSGLGERST
ncbi:hypothetical protein Lal_00031364 [Lupinus albus]|nr:hypothetical protein Lal_00031364 [Lupinus albus]